MAKLSSKQLNTKITGSYTFSGSSHSFIGDVIASNNISGSSTSTGSFGAVYVGGMTNSNLVDVSSSISTRLSTEETNVDNLQTDSGSFSTRISNLKTDSGSFSTRVTTNTSTGSILAGTGNIQGLGTTNNVQFNHITASGNISSSGTVYADKFQSTGGDSDGILFTDDLNITGSITAVSYTHLRAHET